MTAVKISSLAAVSTIDPVNDVMAVVDVSADATKKVSINNVRRMPSYSWANLPDAATYQWQIIPVTDNDGSPLVYSDGTQWRYVSDGTPVKMESVPSGSMIFTTTAPGVANVTPPIIVPVSDLSFSTTAPTVV